MFGDKVKIRAIAERLVSRQREGSEREDPYER